MKQWILTLAVCFILATAAFATDFDQSVAVLNMMGVMEGDGKGDYMPDQNLTRAQFCKMAVVMLGEADKEPLHRNRTVFPDVTSTHWARGYINLAVSTTIGGEEGTQLIRGTAEGTFDPDRNITYGEAVTILVRMLGYSDLDAGMLWPQGYLDLADKIGLTKGISLTAYESMTRREAAHLFTNLLLTDQKGGNAYYNHLGSGQADVILTEIDATVDGKPAVDTSVGTNPLKNGVISADLLGLRGVLLTDETDSCVAFIPQGGQESIVVERAQATWLRDTAGNTHWIDGEIPVYFSEDEETTYDKIWADLNGGATLTIFQSTAGVPEAIYVFDRFGGEILVAPQVYSGNPFSQLLGGATNYTIYRDGILASAKDLETYDVGSYNGAAKVLTVSSNKLTGIYETASPNADAPITVTVMGATLPVLPIATRDLANFKLGDTITLLLTGDGSVAGAVSADKVAVDNLGIVTVGGSEAEVALFNGAVSHCETNSTTQVGDLVKLVSTSRGITVYQLSQQHTYGGFNKKTNQVGGVTLSPNCRYFDRVGSSGLLSLQYEDIVPDTVPNNGVGYVHMGLDGKIDVLVFENLTGDLYTYGKLHTLGEDGGLPANAVYCVNGAETTTALYNNRAITPGVFGGIVASKYSFDDMTKVEDICLLTKGETVTRSDFVLEDGDYYVISGNQKFLVAENVQCYNENTDLWMDDFAQLRSFSDSITVYYDRPALDGGKIRVVVAEP